MLYLRLLLTSLFLICGFSGLSGSSLADGVSQARGTADGKNAHGGPLRGPKLVNAMEFPNEGPGYIKLFQYRNLNYATSELVELVLSAVGEYHRTYPAGGLIQIGNFSKIHGGWNGYSQSHQNGTDVDFPFLTRSGRLNEDRENDNFLFSVVIPGRNHREVISPDFDPEKNWNFMKILVDSGQVSRMFVNGAVKRALCHYTSAIGVSMRGLNYETHRRITVWEGHKDHFHLRIVCPERSRECVDYPPEIPENTGC